MIDELMPYPEYKDSGLPWLGSIPAHWNMKRMKHLFSIRNDRGFPDEPMLAATQTKGVVRKDHYGSRTVLALKDLHQLKLVEVGDFVISLRSFQGGIEYARHRGIISPAYTILYANDSSTHGYFASLFKSRQFIDVLGLYVTGIRQGQNIDYDRLSRSSLPIPPQNEQNAIALFVRKINKACVIFIRNRRRLIDALNEQKQAIINRIVTRGLSANAPLKPSGIDWLGVIPAHWKIVRNIALFAQRVESGVDALPVLQVSLNSGVTIEELDQFGRPKRLIADVKKYKRVYKYDLAYNTMRMWQGAVGVVPFNGLVSPAYVVLKPRKNIFSKYYNLVFRSNIYKQQMNRHSTGIVSDRNRLYWQRFKQMPNIMIPLKEQHEIVTYFEQHALPIDKAVASIKSEIALIREYRTHLISDVVTGKINVRHLAPTADSKDIEKMAEALDPLEDDIVDDVMDDEKEDINEPD